MANGRKLVEKLNKKPNKDGLDDAENSKSLKKKRTYSDLRAVKSPAMEKAEEIQANLSPKFPSMVKLMLPSHVTGGFWLGLPRSFCNSHLPVEDTEIILEYGNGEGYKTKYLATKAGLSGGWRGFSMLHKLVEGDVIIFQLIKPNKLKVYIVRSNSSDEVNEDCGILMLEAPASQIECDDTQDTPQENVQDDSLMILDIYENDSDENGLEVIEAIQFSQPSVDFREVTSLKNFNVTVNDLIIDSEFSKHALEKYYELCCSQNSYLHEKLIDGLNCKLAAGIISEIVIIADLIKSCKVSTAEEQFTQWDKKLKAFEDMGMNVGFMRAKIIKLLSIGSRANNSREDSLRKIALTGKEMKDLQDKLLHVKEAAKKIDVEIEDLKKLSEKRNVALFQQEVDAPWALIESSNLLMTSENQMVLEDSSQLAYLNLPKQLTHQRLAVPVGVRFQAEIPDWTEPVKKCDLVNSMWLGTQVWPVEDEITKISLNQIGKGRADTCQCAWPGSSECVRDHVFLKRLDVESEIGEVFLSWKFNEIGDIVSNSWSLKEQKEFSDLRHQKRKKGTTFWEEASKCFPSKSKKDILGYYFNVYVPKILSIQTKTMSYEEADSDDEQEEDEICEPRRDSPSPSNDGRRQYLRRACQI